MYHGRTDQQEIGDVKKLSSSVTFAVWSETMDARVVDAVHLSTTGVQNKLMDTPLADPSFLT